MANFPLPSDLQTQYFQILKSIKPSININDKNSDFVIRGIAFSRFMSGAYGDQQKVNNDTYIGSARPEALTLRGDDLALAQQPATQSESPQARITGTVATVVSAGLTMQYVPTGIVYQVVTAGVINGSGYFDATIQALTAGQIGNVLAPDTLSIISPPPGITQSVSLLQSLSDGSDIESTDSYRQRLLSRFQNPPAGGNQTDYPAFGFAADPSVRTVTINRFGRGLGTVDVYITTGTTDIDSAVTNGLSIVRVPTSLLIAAVQAYYDAHVPLTDCAEVFGPTEITQNVTMNYVLAPGLTLTSIPSDPINNPLNLTVQQLMDREVGRALYKVPIGGYKITGFTDGFVLASAIEESVDKWLSAEIDTATQLPIGIIPILVDRQVQQLNPPNYNQSIAGNNIVAPGTITLIAGV
jgi:uncharacterized phage protein gp47/JayE